MDDPPVIHRVRAAYGGLTEGDIASLMKMVAADAEYHNPDHAMEPGTRRGRDQVEAALQNLLMDIDITEAGVLRWATRDEEVLAEFRWEGQGKASGATISLTSGNHFVFSNGLIKRFEWFSDWDTAAEQAGLDDSWQLSQ